MRPRGEIRVALTEAAQALAKAGASAATWRDMAQRAGVGYQAARQTVERMALHGDLRRAGEVRVPHSRRPMALYAPADRVAHAEPCPVGGLSGVANAWVRSPAGGGGFMR